MQKVEAVSINNQIHVIIHIFIKSIHLSKIKQVDFEILSYIFNNKRKR